MMEDDGMDEGPSRPAEGRYANYFKIGHNAFEFLLDFGQFYPETDQAQLHTRIVTTPVYAKAFFETLRDSLDQYQRAFGSLARQEWE